MIQANELRIGNLLTYKDEPNRLLKVDEIGYNSQKNRWIRFENGDGSIINEKSRQLIGIPVTEEWLVRFGFDKFENPNGTPSWCYSKAGDVWMYQTWKDKEFFVRSFSLRKQKNINYIHQLQNLYFIMIGEELELNKEEVKWR